MTLGHKRSRGNNLPWARGERFRHVLERTPGMTAYEFYSLDATGKEHFFGMLPERRKNPERITRKSVLNWGWKVIGANLDVKDIYFVRVDI